MPEKIILSKTSYEEHPSWNKFIDDISKKFFEKFKYGAIINLIGIPKYSPFIEILSIQYPRIQDEKKYAIRFIITYHIHKKLITINRFAKLIDETHTFEKLSREENPFFSSTSVDSKHTVVDNADNRAEIYIAINKLFSEKITLDT